MRTGRGGRGVRERGWPPHQDTGASRAPPARDAPVASGPGDAYGSTRRRGDDGTTGLLYGGRVRKDSWRIELNGAVDEAQAAIGLARAETRARAPRSNERLTALARDLYVLMAEVATAPGEPGQADGGVDPGDARRWWPPSRRGSTTCWPASTCRATSPSRARTGSAAALDLARTVVRRAERLAVAEPVEGSLVVPYLNRLSDLLWAMARWQEGEHTLSKDGPT